MTSDMIDMICIGDQHFQNNNVKEVELFIEKVEKLCMNKSPERIILLGDLLHHHEKIYTQSLNKAYEFIDKMRKISPVIILVGNHDMCSNQEFMTSNHWLNGLKEWEDVTVVDKAYVEMIDGMKFIFMPYLYNGRFEEGLNSLECDWKDAKCIFAHQEFLGCKMGAFDSIEGDKWHVDNPYIISGHIHINQTPQENIYYPGSAFQHSFGDSSNNIIAHVTFMSDKKKYLLDEIDLCLPKKKIIYKDIEDLEDFKIDSCNNYDNIKLSISGNVESFKTFKKTKKYKKMIDNGIKIVFKPKKIDIINKENKDKEYKDNSFKSILHDLIEKENDKNLYDIYNILIKQI
jgi:DNA repair exonuclease SbcCD nuclease subunit